MSTTAKVISKKLSSINVVPKKIDEDKIEALAIIKKDKRFTDIAEDTYESIQEELKDRMDHGLELDVAIALLLEEIVENNSNDDELEDDENPTEYDEDFLNAVFESWSLTRIDAYHRDHFIPLLEAKKDPRVAQIKELKDKMTELENECQAAEEASDLMTAFKKMREKDKLRDELHKLDLAVRDKPAEPKKMYSFDGNRTKVAWNGSGMKNKAFKDAMKAAGVDEKSKTKDLEKYFVGYSV